MNTEWKEGVSVNAGEFSDGKSFGKIFSADFEKNIVVIHCANGYHWKGTSQQFSEIWHETISPKQLAKRIRKTGETVSLIDNIQTAQVQAGENAVIANLRKLGL